MGMGVQLDRGGQAVGAATDVKVQLGSRGLNVVAATDVE